MNFEHSRKVQSRQNVLHISHAVVTQRQPVIARAHCLAPENLKATKLEFEFMLQQGLYRPSKSCWATPLHLVLKKNGDWKPYGYRKFNDNRARPLFDFIFTGLYTIPPRRKSIFNNRYHSCLSTNTRQGRGRT